MLTPVPATLPDSTLAPADIAAKFQGTSLAGLGDTDCDESGCYETGYGGGSSVDLCALYPGPGCPGGLPTYNGPGSTTGYPTRTITSGGGGGTDYSALIGQLIRAGVDVSKLALIQPGTTQQVNGATSRQNPGYSIPGTNTASLGVSAGGNGMMYLALGAVAVFFFMNQKGK